MDIQNGFCIGNKLSLESKEMRILVIEVNNNAGHTFWARQYKNSIRKAGYLRKMWRERVFLRIVDIWQVYKMPILTRSIKESQQVNSWSGVSLTMEYFMLQKAELSKVVDICKVKMIWKTERKSSDSAMMFLVDLIWMVRVGSANDGTVNEQWRWRRKERRELHFVCQCKNQ